jgi:hypothetical protein
MIVTHKLLKDAMATLWENKKMMRDKWQTLAAWKTLIYSCYDFGTGLDFNIQLLRKGLALVGSVSKKVSAGNDTRNHSCKKWKGKGKKCMFVCMPSSNKTAPSEPTMTED